MPKSSFRLNQAMSDILWSYVRGEIDEDDVSEQVDELAYYQGDVHSGVNNYYLGIE